MRSRLRAWRGVMRSLRIYYADRHRHAAMDRLYARFMAAGDLVFDVGAHVGDRTASFRRLGCRVVAVEPQPALARLLKLLFAFDRAVHVEAVAVGRQTGYVDLRVNVDNPTVSTASPALIDAATDAPAWRDQRWNKSIRVPITTLDALIARHGRPAFIKIDVEGFESDVLSGLNEDVPALSFEFTTIQRGVALDALDRCEVRGLRRFNAALGESQRFVFPDWTDAITIRAWLRGLPEDANSGDVYAAR